jgi:cytohesin
VGTPESLAGYWSRVEVAARTGQLTAATVSSLLLHAAGKPLQPTGNGAGLRASAIRWVAHVPALEALLAAGADPNRGELEDRGPLHIAAASGCAAACMVLLAAGALVTNAANASSPLRDVGGNPEVASLLLAAGADANTPSGYLRDTPLHTAARGGHAGVVQVLLRAGADVHARNVHGATPMLVAQDVAVVRTLLAAGADPSAVDCRGLTPLHGVEDAEACRALLAAGVSVNAAALNGCTPLFYARTVGAVECLLSAGADATRLARDGASALHGAALYDAGICAALTRAGVSVHATSATRDGGTPLHLASDVEVVRALLAAGAPVNARDARGRTPLLTSFGTKSALALIEAGADAAAASDDRRTALHRAQSGGACL